MFKSTCINWLSLIFLEVIVIILATFLQLDVNEYFL